MPQLGSAACDICGLPSICACRSCHGGDRVAVLWLGIAISHYRFLRGYMMQGREINKLPYHTEFFPIGTIFAFVLCLIITLGQNYQAFLQDRIDWYGVTATYIGIPLFLVIWFGYKLSRGTKVIKYQEMEFPKWRDDSEDNPEPTKPVMTSDQLLVAVEINPQ